MSIPPSTSLFVQNINDKVKKEELRRTLYALFSSYGKVIDVIHTRDPKVRGTAFIVFRDLASSTAAMRALDGEAFFGKVLKISYSKSISHSTIALTEGPEAVYAIKLGLVNSSSNSKGGKKLTVSGAQKKLIEDGKSKKRGRAGGDEGEGVEEEEEEEEESEEEEGDGDKRGEKKAKKGGEGGGVDEDAMEEDSDDDDDDNAPLTTSSNSKAPTGPATAAEGSEPNNILFIEGLPAELTNDMLTPLFQQYPGLSSLKLLPTAQGSPENSGLAFVQYESLIQARMAKEALDGFLLNKGAPMKVSWAKRA